MSGESKQQALRENETFQDFPPAMREWILASPNATQDFAEFFGRGGDLDLRSDVRLPSYSPTQPPRINVNRDIWANLREPGTEWGQRAMFAQMAHEVGHDRFNPGTVPFTGKSADDYVKYRSNLEANAIFNAFPIFQDLKQHPDFREQFPFQDIGYLNGLELGQLYKEWNAGKLTDKAVVDRIAAQIPERPHTLGGLQDQNADGKLTHRDAYLRDYSQYVAPRMKPQASQSEPDTPMTQSLRAGVVGLDSQAGKGWDDASERLYASLLVLSKEKGFGPDDKLQVGFNLETSKYGAGELIHVERTGLSASPDPAANRAWIPTADALATPATENLRKAESIAPPTPELVAQQQQAVGQDDPARQGPVIRMG